MNEQGYQPFMDAFRALNKGTFFPIGGRGVKIILHGAHSIPRKRKADPSFHHEDRLGMDQGANVATPCTLFRNSRSSAGE